ncbi:hypothetical protein K438DRAFT_1752127 [Mycena galopus ATCC 62051]|nr:hypothetical protein K438DRAFT_1752127 [Mycena galopus ATCC 62051]
MRCRGRPDTKRAALWKQDWTDSYFDTSTLVDEANIENGATTPIFVDVGGNIGVDVTHFLAKHPDVPTGSLVLQNVGDVISLVKVDPKIRFGPWPMISLRRSLSSPACPQSVWHISVCSGGRQSDGGCCQE